MQSQLGVSVAGHGVVGFLCQRCESLVTELPGIDEGRVEELELLLGDDPGAAPVDGVEESLGVILEPHGEVGQLPGPAHGLPPDLDPLLNTHTLLLSGALRHLTEGITEVKALLLGDELGCRLEEIVDKEFVDFTESQVVGIVGVPLHVVSHPGIQAVKVLLRDDVVSIQVQDVVEEMSKLVLLEI